MFQLKPNEQTLDRVNGLMMEPDSGVLATRAGTTQY